MPRSCTGAPSSAKTGRSIQAKSGTNPVDQSTLATSSSRPSSSTGRPPRAPTVRGTRRIPAAEKSFGLIRASGRPTWVAPWAWNFRRIARPIGVLMVSTRDAMNQITGSESRSPLLPGRKGSWPGCRPDSHVRCSLDTSKAISAPSWPHTGASRPS